MAGTAQAAVRADLEGGCYRYTWTLTTANTDGIPINHPGASDRTVELDGTWGGATAVVEGSCKATAPATLKALTDPQGNAISKTADAIEAISENVNWIAPRLSVAGAGATVVVTLLVRSTMR